MTISKINNEFHSPCCDICTKISYANAKVLFHLLIQQQEKEIHRVDKKKAFIYENKWWCVCAAITTKLTRVVFSAGYQGFKRCRHGKAEDDGDLPALEDNSEKVKDLGLENGVFKYDDSSNTEEKKKDSISNTHLWGHWDFDQDFLEFHIGPKSVGNWCQDDIFEKALWIFHLQQC